MCDFAKYVKLHKRKTIANRLLSRTDNATIYIGFGAIMILLLPFGLNNQSKIFPEKQNL